MARGLASPPPLLLAALRRRVVDGDEERAAVRGLVRELPPPPAPDVDVAMLGVDDAKETTEETDAFRTRQFVKGRARRVAEGGSVDASGDASTPRPRRRRGDGAAMTPPR